MSWASRIFIDLMTDCIDYLDDYFEEARAAFRQMPTLMQSFAVKIPIITIQELRLWMDK